LILVRHSSYKFLGGGYSMPLARIFTRNPERTTDLSSQLQQQGYKVEVVSPDQTHLAPADLEIEFELCERTDVLARAADLATELEADVAVAPGILQPVALQSSVPAAQPGPAVPVHAQSVTESANTMNLQSETPETKDPEREFEAAFAPVIEMPANVQAMPSIVEIPVIEQEPLPPVAFLDDEVKLEPVKIAQKNSVAAPVEISEPSFSGQTFSEPSRAADPMPYLAQLTPFSTPASHPPSPQGSDRKNYERISDAASSEPAHKVLESGAKIAARTWADALALTSSTAASVRNHFQEYKKRAQVRSAEARAAHAARLLDLEQRRAEAQQRATELEAARRQAAARLVELVRQRDPGLHESQPEQRLHESILADESMSERSTLWEDPREDREHVVPPVASSVPAHAAMKSDRTTVASTPIHLWRKINPPLRAVLTGAAAVSALFIMGIALGLFHSRTPLANPANHASNSAAQSGGVTVQTGGSPTGGVTVQTAAAKPQPSQTSAKSAQPETATQTTAKPSPRIQQTQHLVAEQSEKEIGDDVVIRHFSRPMPTQKPKQAGQQAGLKHFSDLDN
jgi:hypothetical protein